MNALERSKRFLNYAVRPVLRVLPLALFAASAYAIPCSLGSGTTFIVTGAFDDGGISSNGSVLGGTVNIDTTGCGGVISANMVVTGNPVATGGPLDFTGSPNSQGYVSSSNYYYADFTDDGWNLNLDIYIGSATNLDGYTGGALCSDGQSCTGSVKTLYGEDPNLSSGSLSLASSTPEPSSALLLFGGALALTGLSRRRRSA
jgi:hypothetical protein